MPIEESPSGLTSRAEQITSRLGVSTCIRGNYSRLKRRTTGKRAGGTIVRAHTGLGIFSQPELKTKQNKHLIIHKATGREPRRILSQQ